VNVTKCPQITILTVYLPSESLDLDALQSDADMRDAVVKFGVSE